MRHRHRRRHWTDPHPTWTVDGLRAKSVRSRCVRPVFVSGDRVVIRWIFDFGWRDGSSTRMEELAYQRWSGDRIAEEQFFYDPAQLAKDE